MHSRNLMGAAIIVVAGMAAACSGAATASPTSSGVATVPTKAPASAASRLRACRIRTGALSTGAHCERPVRSSEQAGCRTVDHRRRRPLGSHGTLVVAGSERDDRLHVLEGHRQWRGKSACTGAVPRDVAGADRAGGHDGFRRQRGRRQDGIDRRGRTTGHSR